MKVTVIVQRRSGTQQYLHREKIMVCLALDSNPFKRVTDVKPVLSDISPCTKEKKKTSVWWPRGTGRVSR